MLASSTPPHRLPADDIVLASRVRRAGAPSAFYRAVDSGDFRRVAPGAYVAAGRWATASADERFLLRVHAAAAVSRPGLLFSHHAAAALWRLPIVGGWPWKPDATVGATGVGERRAAFRARKCVIPDDVGCIEGLSVTSLPRTLVDVGRTAPLSVSVTMMDHALSNSFAHQVTRTALVTELARAHGVRGTARCRTAIELADGDSGSPGESVSRVAMYVLGAPEPTLQQRWFDDRGLIGITDFSWPELGAVGEFDGRGKYLREEYTRGRDPGEVVVEEKWREDRLRAIDLQVARWDWHDAWSLPRLAQHLKRVGVPVGAKARDLRNGAQ